MNATSSLKMTESLADTFSLLVLPGEIRNCIYAVLFQQPFRIVLGAKTDFRKRNLAPQGSQILETCRQVHDEAAPFLYRNITIKLTRGSAFDVLIPLNDSKYSGKVEKMTILRPGYVQKDFSPLWKMAMLQFCHLYTLESGKNVFDHVLKEIDEQESRRQVIDFGKLVMKFTYD